MLRTLKFPVVAMHQGLFPVSHTQLLSQVCRSWEEEQPDWQPKLANGNIPYHRQHAQFMYGGWLGGSRAGISSTVLCEFESSLFWEFGLFGEFCEIRKNPWVWGSVIAARGLTANWSLGGEKKCI